MKTRTNYKNLQEHYPKKSTKIKKRNGEGPMNFFKNENRRLDFSSQVPAAGALLRC